MTDEAANSLDAERLCPASIICFEPVLDPLTRVRSSGPAEPGSAACSIVPGSIPPRRWGNGNCLELQAILADLRSPAPPSYALGRLKSPMNCVLQLHHPETLTRTWHAASIAPACLPG